MKKTFLRKKSIFFTLCVWSLCLIPSVSVFAMSLDELAKRAEERRLSIAQNMEESTVLIVAVDGDDVAFGSGFVVASGYILTNGHVTGGAETIYVAGKLFDLQEAELIKERDDAKQDFALLKFAQPKNIPILSFELATRRTDRVSAWGYPGIVTQFDHKYDSLLEGDFIGVPPIVYTEGSVSSFVDSGHAVSIVHTAAIAGGNSGGPLINSKGHVVGVNTWGAAEAEDGEVMFAALTSRNAISFIRSCGVDPRIVSEGAVGQWESEGGQSRESGGGQRQREPQGGSQGGFLGGSQGGGLFPSFGSKEEPPQRSGDVGGLFALGEGAVGSSSSSSSAASSASSALAAMTGGNSSSSGAAARHTATDDRLSSEMQEYHEQAVQGDMDAQAYLGISYYFGDEAPEDEQLGVYWLRKAAEQGSVDAKAVMGVIEITDAGYRNVAHGLQWLKEAAGKDARYGSNLAEYLLFGEIYGIAQDVESAVIAARRGAEVDDPEAIALLAYLYFSGKGVERDLREALRLAQLAAKEDISLAFSVLSWLYHQGEGVAKDAQRAFEFAQKAADEEDAEGMGLLAYYYYSGVGVRENMDKAVQWAERAAEVGNDLGRTVLGHLYASGDGVRKDTVLGYAYAALAAENGYDSAQKMLKEWGAELNKKQQDQARKYVQAWRQQWQRGE